MNGRSRERRLSRCEHGEYDDGGIHPTVWTDCRGSIERPVWPGRGGNSRHGSERVQVELHLVDLSRSAGNHPRDVLHEKHEGDALEFGEWH